MSDFRCEWQALHGPRCSHQCNECKDNDTPPEPRMTSERQETEQAFERWYNHAFATRGVDTKHMNDCEDAFEAGRTLALRATPRAGSASKERGFFEWSCGCSLNNGLVTPCATHASPAAAPREHPSPEPYCASCDAREGEPCPHNVIQCARPRRAHLPRAETDETREAVAFTASAGTCRRCGSRVRMGGPAPDSCTNCAAPAESHPPRAGEVTEDQEMMNAFVREIDHYRNLLADAYVTIGCAVASEDGLDGSEADAFHAKVRRLWPAAVDHPTVARWLALPEEGDTDILGRPS